MKVLIVEDEEAIAQPLAEGLARAGFDPTHVANGSDAIDSITHDEPDVVLLDIRLPDMDGLSVCRQVRTWSHVPIIIVSSLDDEVDRVVGLEVGADDYVVKPFGIRELVARIRAVTRRSTERADRGGNIVVDQQIRVGSLRIDNGARAVWVDDRSIDLTRREFDLLSRLAADPGGVVSRESLMRDVWQTTWYGSGKTIDVHVGGLRRKLGSTVSIEAVRGVGYRLTAATA